MGRKHLLGRRISGILRMLITVGVLAGLAFSFRLLFASRNEQHAQTAQPSPSRTPSSALHQPPSVSSSPSPVAFGQANPRTNWSTYINSEYNYFIKYPANWSFSEDNAVSLEDRTIYFYDAASKPEEEYFEGITVGVRRNDENLSLDEWPEQLYREMSGGLSPKGALSVEKVAFAEQQALKVFGIPSRTTEYYVLVPFPNEQKVLVVTLDLAIESAKSGGKSKYEEVLYSMMSSLHFRYDQ